MKSLPENYSLIYAPRGMIRLSPAYDLLPTTLLIPEDKEETALSINGRKAGLERRDFLELGRSLKLNEKQTDNVLKRFEAAFPEAVSFIERGFLSEEKKLAYAGLMKQRMARMK